MGAAGDQHRPYPRRLTLTGYAEFTNHSNYEQDQVNLQYSLFISRTVFAGNRLTQQIHGNLDALAAGEDVDDKQVTERFFGLAGAPVASYCGDKQAFLGRYHSYGDPQGWPPGTWATWTATTRTPAARCPVLWLNPQSWAVISGLADANQAEGAMDQVYTRLNTPYGAVLMDPPYHAHAFDGALAVIYNPGTKENAGIFSQTQGWLILAEALRGQGQRAYTYFAENAPAAQNDRAEVRHLEPYCYGQFTEGPASKHFGRSQVHWLTGTASTVMVGCVEGILGLRPDLDGLRLAPAIPREWTGFTMDKDFRGCRLHIRVENPHHRESGFTSLTSTAGSCPTPTSRPRC